MKSLGSRRLRRALLLALGVVVTLALARLAYPSLLVGVAAWLVEDDAVQSADVIVISNSMPRAAALEAAALYAQGVSSRIVMGRWVEDPVNEQVQALGIPYLGVTEMNQAILEHSGVPLSAITVLDDHVDGTESEVSAVNRFVRRHRPRSLLFITARSHTARSKWLLQHRLPGGTRVAVHSPRFDSFSVDGWWLDRASAREVITEYLRWFNTSYLRDLWRRPPSPEAGLAQMRPATSLQ